MVKRQGLGPLVKVKYLKSTCSHKKGDVGYLRKAVAKTYRRRGIVKILKNDMEGKEASDERKNY